MKMGDTTKRSPTEPAVAGQQPDIVVGDKEQTATSSTTRVMLDIWDTHYCARCGNPRRQQNQEGAQETEGLGAKGTTGADVKGKDLDL